MAPLGDAVVEMSTHALLASVNCHLPCVFGLAVLAVIATPASELPSISLKLFVNSDDTRAPAGAAVSSLTAVRVAEPEATGASFTALMVMVMVVAVHLNVQTHAFAQHGLVFDDLTRLAIHQPVLGLGLGGNR